MQNFASQPTAKDQMQIIKRETTGCKGSKILSGSISAFGWK